QPSGSKDPPAVWFAYSPDRKSEHPDKHLAMFRGTLQADAFPGFNRLDEKGSIVEAACWAHVRRKFYDLFEAHASPIAKEWKVIRILGHHNMREQIWSSQPARNRTMGSRLLHDTVTSRATEFRPHGPNHFEPRRHKLQHFRN